MSSHAEAVPGHFEWHAKSVGHRLRPKQGGKQEKREHGGQDAGWCSHIQISSFQLTDGEWRSLKMEAEPARASAAMRRAGGGHAARFRKNRLAHAVRPMKQGNSLLHPHALWSAC